MSSSQQTKLAAEKNRDFFAENDDYKSIQGELEHYRFIALSASDAVRGARRLLDIGNGGVFIYNIEGIPRIVAIDIFVEPSFSQRYPGVIWREMSALDLAFDREFDTLIEINTLHHIVGANVQANYANLASFFSGAYRSLEPGGTLVLIESTVPKWFLTPYKWIFPLFTRFWPFKHPPTFQFNYRDLLKAGADSGFDLREFCWVPKTSDVLAFGVRVKSWMSPIQTAKMVFVKPRDGS